jgi:preprotein translocase SecE subunit
VAEKIESKRKPNAIQRFTRETMGELHKVSWPTTAEALNLTKIVLIVLFAMAMLLGLLDYGFSVLVTKFLV